MLFTFFIRFDGNGSFQRLMEGIGKFFRPESCPVTLIQLRELRGDNGFNDDAPAVIIEPVSPIGADDMRPAPCAGELVFFRTLHAAAEIEVIQKLHPGLKPLFIPRDLTVKQKQQCRFKVAVRTAGLHRETSVKHRAAGKVSEYLLSHALFNIQRHQTFCHAPETICRAHDAGIFKPPDILCGGRNIFFHNLNFPSI